MNCDRMTRETLQARLIEAGATLLSMQDSSTLRGFRCNLPRPVQEAAVAYGYEQVRLRVQRPTGAQISRMDEALAWVSLIPASPISADPGSYSGGATLRRLVNCRLLVEPMSWYQTPDHPTHLFSFRKLGALMGADPKSVKLWHGAALGLICDALNLRMAA